MTMKTLDITVAGTIKPDGSLQLDEPANFPPGPVQVTLRSIPTTLPSEAPRRPDGPWSDESISAPFDLPRPAQARPVHTRRGTLRLPDPVFAEENSEQ